MISIAICDDEAYMSDEIRKMASAFFRKKNIEAAIVQFACGEDLLKYGKPVDVLFLDIQMKGMDGMKTAKMLRERGFKGVLIFITVLKEMVFSSFEVQAFDYLVKPVGQRQFDQTMERFLLSMQHAGEANLLVKKGYESHIISLDDIVYCEIIDRKVYLHLASAEVVDYYERIEHLENRLDDRFFRCHRSFLINLQYLKSYQNQTAFMENGAQIPVSRLRGKEFSDVILRYMQDWRR